MNVNKSVINVVQSFTAEAHLINAALNATANAEPRVMNAAT